MSPGGDDRYCAGGCADGQRDGRADGNDHVRVPADHLASQIGKVLGQPLAGIPLDGEVLFLDIAQPAQLPEKRLPGTSSGVADACDGTCRNDDRNPVLLRAFLRPHRSWGAREQQTDREIAPSHSITSSARASNIGGMVRFSSRAVFKLMYSS